MPRVAQVELPNELSSLIRVAVNDGFRLNPRTYKPNSGTYHEYSSPDDHKCNVCLAGGGDGRFTRRGTVLRKPLYGRLGN